MRIIGFVLVLLGVLALGYQEFSFPGWAPAGRGPASVPPVVAGIAVVSGLLVLTLSGRREPT